MHVYTYRGMCFILIYDEENVVTHTRSCDSARITERSKGTPLAIQISRVGSNVGGNDREAFGVVSTRLLDYPFTIILTDRDRRGD